jgi:hypothetical protein
MTIPDPIKVLLAEAHRLVSDEAAPLAELKLLHAYVTRLRNQFYDELDEANINWENERGGDPGLQQVKQEIDSQVVILADRIMAIMHKECVSITLVDRVPRGLDEEDNLFDPQAGSIPDLLLVLGSCLFDAEGITSRCAKSDEPRDCLLNWQKESVADVEALIRQLHLLAPIDIAAGSLSSTPISSTCFWVALWAFSVLRTGVDSSQPLTVKDCERLLPSLSPTVILEWCNDSGLEKCELTRDSIDYLAVLVPRRVARLMMTFVIGGVVKDNGGPASIEMIDTSFPWVLS